MSGKRGNGEGSIYPYREGYAAYVWVTTPAGRRQRKYVYGKTREVVHEKWLKLHQQAARGPVVPKVPTVKSLRHLLACGHRSPELGTGNSDELRHVRPALHHSLPG